MGPGVVDIHSYNPLEKNLIFLCQWVSIIDNFLVKGGTAPTLPTASYYKFHRDAPVKALLCPMGFLFCVLLTTAACWDPWRCSRASFTAPSGPKVLLLFSKYFKDGGRSLLCTQHSSQKLSETNGHSYLHCFWQYSSGTLIPCQAFNQFLLYNTRVCDTLIKLGEV